MGINNKVLYSIIVATFLAGIGTAYAGPALTNITLGGNVVIIGSTDLDGTLLDTVDSAGASGQFLTSTGTGVQWTSTAPGSGTVTSVGTGTGLTGGPITSTGTISIDTAVVPQLGIENTFTNDMNIAGELFLDGDLSVGEGLGNNDDTIFFDEEINPATLRWDDFDDRFEFNNELAMQAPILIGSNEFAPVSYNRFTTPGDSSNISTHGLVAFSDLFIGGSLEADGSTWLDGPVIVAGETQLLSNLDVVGGISTGSLGVSGVMTTGGNIDTTGKITAGGGVDPPYVSFSAETHDTIRQFAEDVADHEEVMFFWNTDSKQFQVYYITEDAFYTLNGDKIEE